MSNTPPTGQPPGGAGSGPPFGGGGPQQPNQPGQPEQPSPGGDPTAGYSLMGLALGFFIVLLPAVLFGVFYAILVNVDISAAIQVLVPLILAIAIPAALFFLMSSKLKDGTPKQETLRTAMRIIVFVGIGTYALGGLVIGGCIALLVGAY